MKQYKSRKFEKMDSDRPGKRDFGRNNSDEGFDRRDSGRSSSKDSGFQLYHAICDKCGKDCDIPFKPTGNKPVYCRSCFKANESGGRFGSFDRGRFDNRSESRERFETKNTSSVSKEDIDKINRKLDKIMRTLKIS